MHYEHCRHYKVIVNAVMNPTPLASPFEDAFLSLCPAPPQTKPSHLLSTHNIRTVRLHPNHIQSLLRAESLVALLLLSSPESSRQDIVSRPVPCFKDSPGYRVSHHFKDTSFCLRTTKCPLLIFDSGLMVHISFFNKFYFFKSQKYI